MAPDQALNRTHVATLRTKVKKAALLTTAAVLFLAAFIVDVINWSVDIEWGWLNIARHGFVIGAFVVLYFLIESLWKRDQSPVKKIGFALVLTVVVGATGALLSLVAPVSFEAKNNLLLPADFGAILLANVYGVVFGSTMLLVLLILRDIILAKRKRGTQ